MTDVITLLAATAIWVAFYFVQPEDRNVTQGRAQQSEPLRDNKHNVSSEKIRVPGTTATGCENEKIREPQTSDTGREDDDKIDPWTRHDMVRDDFIHNLLGTEGRANQTPGSDNSIKPVVESADDHIKEATLEVPGTQGGKVGHHSGHKSARRTHRH